MHKSRSKHYTSFSNWDTYRTQIQLLSMLDPEVASDIVISHQLFAEQSGGSFPRWVMANIETGVMQGDPTPILIANAYAFGARNYDPKPIFKIMRKGAEEPGSKSQDVETRPGLKQYLDKGYYNASIQLEYTSADFAIGQFALHAVGDEFASWRYFHFARSWKNLYNSDTGWLQSRNPDGSWKSLGEDFRESTYKNYFWMVPYDIAGLVEIIGGKEKAEKQTRRRRDAAQRRGKLGISTVIVVLIAVFLLRGHTMDQRNAAYVEELAQLQNKIDAEEARTQDIADLEAYMQTDEYAEQVAKDKLGLVYEDEIIFKPEEN